MNGLQLHSYLFTTGSDSHLKGPSLSQSNRRGCRMSFLSPHLTLALVDYQKWRTSFAGICTERGLDWLGWRIQGYI